MQPDSGCPPSNGAGLQGVPDAGQLLQAAAAAGLLPPQATAQPGPQSAQRRPSAPNAGKRKPSAVELAAAASRRAAEAAREFAAPPRKSSSSRPAAAGTGGALPGRESGSDTLPAGPRVEQPPAKRVKMLPGPDASLNRAGFRGGHRPHQPGMAPASLGARPSPVQCLPAVPARAATSQQTGHRQQLAGMAGALTRPAASQLQGPAGIQAANLQRPGPQEGAHQAHISHTQAALLAAQAQRGQSRPAGPPSGQPVPTGPTGGQMMSLAADIASSMQAGKGGRPQQQSMPPRLVAPGTTAPVPVQRQGNGMSPAALAAALSGMKASQAAGSAYTVGQQQQQAAGPATSRGAVPADAPSAVSVICGTMRGTLRMVHDKAQTWVECEGRRLTGTEFEKVSGKEKAKKWKASVRVLREDGTTGETIGDWLQRFSLDIRKERLIRTGEARAAAAASDGRIQRPAAPKPAPLATAAPSPLAAVRGPTVPLVRTTAAPVTQAQRVAPAQQQPRACAPPAAQQGLPQQQWAPDLQRLLAQQQGPPAQPEPSQGASAQQQGALEAPAQQGMPAQQQQQQLAAEQRRKQQLQLHQITMMKRQLMRARLEALQRAYPALIQTSAATQQGGGAAMQQASVAPKMVPVQRSEPSNGTAAPVRGSQPRLDIQGHLAHQYIGLRAGDPDLTFAGLPKRLGEWSARAPSAAAEAAAAEQPAGPYQAGGKVSVSGVAQAHSSPPAKDAAIPGIGRPTSARASSPPEPPAAAAGKASGETAPGLQPSSLGATAPTAVSGQVPGGAAASCQEQPPAAGTMPLDLAASLQHLPGILASLERLSRLSPDRAEPGEAAVLHPPSGQVAQGSLHAAPPASLQQPGSGDDELPPQPDAGAVLSQAAAALSAAQNAGLAGADLGLPTQQAGQERAVVVDVAALSHEALMAMSAASATNPCRALLERQPGVQASRQAFVTGQVPRKQRTMTPSAGSAVALHKQRAQAALAAYLSGKAEQAPWEALGMSRPPLIAGRDFNLREFYEAVQEFGGYEAASAQRKFSSIAKKLGIDTTIITNAGYLLKGHYQRLIAPYLQPSGSKPAPARQPARDQVLPPAVSGPPRVITGKLPGTVAASSVCPAPGSPSATPPAQGGSQYAAVIDQPAPLHQRAQNEDEDLEMLDADAAQEGLEDDGSDEDSDKDDEDFQMEQDADGSEYAGSSGEEALLPSREVRQRGSGSLEESEPQTEGSLLPDEIDPAEAGDSGQQADQPGPFNQSEHSSDN